MPHVRKIPRKPTSKLAYLVDANFLVNRFIPIHRVANASEQQRVQRSMEWWTEIEAQLSSGDAIVYVPDICIAEAFKVLAKKYYTDGYFRPADHKKAREQLAAFLHTSPKTLRATKRHIRVHDISTSRDVIVAVDRFNEVYLKHNLAVSAIDLIILATAKYLIDFYNIPKKQFHIVTLDNALWRGSKKLTDIPSAFNPNAPSEIASKVFA